MCLVLLYSHAFWVPQNLFINTKTLHALYYALFLEVSEPEASRQERNPASAREELSFLFASAGHSLPWRVDNPSIYSLKEDCLLRREPQGHTLTLTAQVTLSSPRAFINHRLHKKILSIMAIALPHQEGLINELQFQ